MSKKLLVIIILSLLLINIYTLINFHKSKKPVIENTHQNISENDELNSYKINFRINIQNNRIKMEGVTVKDSLELGYPYYFVLHDDLTISNVFVPDKATPAITIKYLELIKKQFFQLRCFG